MAIVHEVVESQTRLSSYTFFPRWRTGKESVCQCREMQEIQVRSLGWEHPLEKEMAIPSSILAWKIPWTEEHDRLQSKQSQRVGHD